VTVAPDASVLEAAHLIPDQRVGGLPVVANGGVVGVITESDLFRPLSQSSAAQRMRRGRSPANTGAE
jgi:acetoin utilization protein AcuB